MSDTFWGNYSSALSALGDVQSQITSRRAGARLAQNDYRGAANTLFESGDLQGGSTLSGVADQRQAADAERQLAFTLQATRALRRTQDEGGDVLAAYDQYAPAFQQMGATPEQVQQLRGQLQQNPGGFLDSIDSIVGQQQRELQFQKTGDNLLVFETGNPDPIRRFEAPRQPIEVGGVLVDPNTYEPILDTREPKYQTVQNSDGTTSVVAIDQPAPVSSGGGGPAAAPSGGVDPVSVIQGLIPGVSFNSGRRTEEQNRSAGGSPNSYHLSGNAVDIPPQRGRDIGEFRRQLEAQGVNVRELIDEGDHWHIAWSGGQAAPNFGRGEAPRSGGDRGGTRVVAQGAQNGLSRAERTAQDRDTRADRKDQTALRREFDGLDAVVDYRSSREAYQRVQSLARSGTPTDDIALIFNFMKMLDPTSVVREGEYALVGRAQGLTGQALLALQRADEGVSLTPELRRSLVATAGREFDVRQQRYRQLEGQYRGYAQEDGFDPDRIVPLERSQGSRTNAPGLPFNINETQLAYRNRLAQNGASASAPLGSARNPYYTNPQDERSGLSNYQRRANESGREVVVITSRGPAIIRPTRGGR